MSLCLLHTFEVNYFIYRKNENYLARFIPFFETQVGLDLNAEDLLTELVRDNRYEYMCPYACVRVYTCVSMHAGVYIMCHNYIIAS